MTRLTPANSAIPLVTGMVTAAALSGAAVFAVLQSGCEEPGSYRARDGVVELIGGCLKPGDLPVNPNPPQPAEVRSPGNGDLAP